MNKFIMQSICKHPSIKQFVSAIYKCQCFDFIGSVQSLAVNSNVFL